MKRRIILLIIALAGALCLSLALAACSKGADPVNPDHQLSFGEWTVKTAPTCEEEGEEIRVCTVCGGTAEGHMESRPVAALGHDWGEGVITLQPTCSAAGEKLVTCKRDSSHTKTDIVSMVPHVYGDWHVTLAPTATRTGIAERDCLYCDSAAPNHTLSFTLDKLTEENRVEGKYIYQELTPATCTAEGEGQYTIDYPELSGFDKSFKAKIAPLGHLLKAEAQNFTVGEGGRLNVTCARCQSHVEDVDYLRGAEFPYNEGSPLALGKTVYFTQSLEEQTGYFKFVISAEGVYNVKIENFGSVGIVGDGEFMYYNVGEEKMTVATLSGGELTSSDIKFSGECSPNLITFAYTAQTSDLGRELIFKIPTSGGQEDPQGLLITSQFPEREKTRIYYGTQQEAEITVADSYFDSYTFIVGEGARSDYKINFVMTSAFADMPRPSGFNLMVFLDGELNEEGMLVGATLIYDYNSFDRGGLDTTWQWETYSIFRGEEGTHTLTFCCTNIGKVKFTISKYQQSLLELDSAAGTPILKAQTPGTQDGGTYNFIVSDKTPAGWYQVYVPVTQGNARNPIAFVVGGRIFEKYYLSIYDDNGGKSEEDSYAMLLYLKPRDEVTLKNIGLLDMSFRMTIKKHTAHKSDAGEWTITPPTQDGEGLAYRTCGLIDEAIVLPALTDGCWTDGGESYTADFGGVTITIQKQQA